MTPSPLDELSPPLRLAVERWRSVSPPADEVERAMDRLALRPPAPASRPAWRWLPAAVLVIGLTGLLAFTPTAWGEAITALRPGPIDPDAAVLARRAGWRPLLLAHVGSLLAGYLGFLLAWAAPHLALVVRLAGRHRPDRPVCRQTTRLVTAAGVLWLVGLALGTVWARAVLGRWWTWTPAEAGPLATLAIAAAWAWLGAGWASERLDRASAIAAAGFWGIVAVWWFVVASAPHTYGHRSAVVPLFLTLCLLVDWAFVLSMTLSARIGTATAASPPTG